MLYLFRMNPASEMIPHSSALRHNYVPTTPGTFRAAPGCLWSILRVAVSRHPKVQIIARMGEGKSLPTVNFY